MQSALGQTWAGFARGLPRKARVLDIASGDGCVMADLLRARSDLKPVGIDQAKALPPAPRGAKLRGGIEMDALPFPDASFAAVTSQFGLEYGEVDAAAREIARVLQPGGVVGLIVHREDSLIVAHNRARAEGIAWAIEQEALPAKALASLRLRLSGLTIIPPDVASGPERAARMFGPGSAAWEIAEATRRALAGGAHAHPAEVRATVEEIAVRGRHELTCIATLSAAAERSGTGERMVAHLVEAGLTAGECRDLRDDRAAKPFASFLTLRKPG
ncbi:class I SAM-dependent methyltransferase [Aurantiacibacter luteus]|uniref:class I SAM-dependent methyltransferase n=1 Tax=Aurantiacibacter luteus TaxID=1581420 RepID=UPI000699B2C4|nr:methyltransferase domain-containing protein [Aurantiacibacter luteus]